MKEEKTFLADCMLGRLAHYLRILGYDTAYAGHLNDQRIVAWSRYEGRILLTRDRDMVRRAGSLAFLVQAERVQCQVEEIVNAFFLDCRNWFTRCPECNRVLDSITRSDARADVPLYVFRGFEQFKRCPGCRRVYWKGTHWEHMKERLHSLRSERDP